MDQAQWFPVVGAIYKKILAVLVMKKKSLISEFWEFSRHKKKVWLFPVFVLLVLAGALVVFTEGSVVTAFIYAMF